MKKISLILIISLLLSLLLPFLAAAEEGSLPLLSDLDQCEKLIYGSSNNTKPVVERIDDLERAVYGGIFPLSIPERIAQVKSLLTEDRVDKTSLFFQLKANEWVTKKKVSYGPLLPRLQELEKLLIGTNAQNSIVERMNSLTAICFKDGVVPAAEVTVNPETLVVVEFLNEVGSKISKEGDPVEFAAAEDVIVDNVLLIPTGSKAFGTVTKAKKAGAFGKDGRLEMDFKTIHGFDGTELPLCLGEKAVEENKRVAAAAGASFAGVVLLGPIGLVGGAFIKGKNIVIEEGSKTYLETLETVPMIGLSLN